ncbi:MAG TPA: MBL fold metallo-hydrolase [Woeseiaceae bacterium]|nr:MBL fold metallo-hydrolase [Woeseiaceae bacterium]
MSPVTRDSIFGYLQRFVQRALTAIFALLALLLLILSMLWRDRVAIDDVGISFAPEASPTDGVTVTWFGVSTLLFDDGETQLLIDGFISRPGVLDLLANRPVDNDAVTINYFLNEFHVDRLAAIIPVHSHYDHAMDVAALASRTSASILGSESTAQIGRGAMLPPEQIVVITDGAEYQFGEFTVRFILSLHAPIGWNGSVPLAGTIDSPLTLPAPITRFRNGDSYSIVISHPTGSALVQGSAGFRPGALHGLQVDTVFLGTGMLESLGRDYIHKYWTDTVTATGATTVIPVHFDDYTRNFGEIELMPKILDDFSVTARILKNLRRTWDSDTQIFLPAFGVPIALRDRSSAET